MVPGRMPSGEEGKEPEGCGGGLEAALQGIRVSGQEGELMELVPEPLQGHGPCLQEEEGLHGLYVCSKSDAGPGAGPGRVRRFVVRESQAAYGGLIGHGPYAVFKAAFRDDAPFLKA